MTGILVQSDGTITVEIPDAKGRVRLYSVTRSTSPNAKWTLALQRRDAGSTYQVSLDNRGLWHCTCPDWKYRHGDRADGCKHIQTARTIWQMIQTYQEEWDMGDGEETTVDTGPDLDAILRALSAPFDASEVKFKPQLVSGNRALAAAYVDARVIMDRLDVVLGIVNWQDEYLHLPDGSVVCKLRLRLGGEWITKEDVGGESEQKDAGDRHKAAVSDALKRAAVKFGLGRYLYRIKPQWCDYDPQKKLFLRKPTLPGAEVKPISPREKALATTEAARQERYGNRGQPTNGTTAPTEPTVRDRAAEFGRKLVGKALAQPGELLTYLKAQLGGKYPGLVKDWPASALADVQATCKAFEQHCRDRLTTSPPVTQEQLDGIENELERTGAGWEGIAAQVGLPEGGSASDMTEKQWQTAMDTLGEMPSIGG